MSTEACEKLDFEMATMRKRSESKSDGESIAKPSSFRHVTHISWKEGKGLEISTNDREFAEFFRDVGDRVCLEEGRDVREVIFDYVSNSLNCDDEEEPEESSCPSNVDGERCKLENIGNPYNFQHVTHCTFDKSDGFKVVTTDRKLSWFYNKKDNNANNKK